MSHFPDLRFCRGIVFRIFLFCTALPVGWPLYAQTTIHVPGGQPTIQAAINAANNGDTVLVADGTYKENIDFKGKAITVTSVNGPATTTIDGGSADTVVKFLSNEGPGSILNGLTITNGAISPTNALSNGGGILVGIASPKITNNVITNNKGCQGGFGIFVAGGGPLIQGNIIVNNSQSSNCSGGLGGGGIGVQGSSGLVITNNVIAGNSAIFGGAITLFASNVPVLIENNIMTGNNGGDQGGAIWMVNLAPAQIIQNLFIHNKADEGGAIFSSASGSGMVVLNNTMANNPSSEGSGIYGEFPADAIIQNNLVIGVAGSSAVFCDLGNLPAAGVIANDIFAMGGTAVDSSCTNPLGTNGNISSDPLFVNAGADNYHLATGSPAIDVGNDTVPVALPPTDLSGDLRIANGIVDIGAFEFSSAIAGFSLGTAPGAFTSATVAAGQSATYHLTVTGNTGFSGNITLACSGVPRAASCSVSPGSLFVDGATSESFAVSIQTTARASGLPVSEYEPDLTTRMLVGTFLALIIFATIGLAVSSRRRVQTVSIAALILIALAGCGGGGSGGGGGGTGTPAGTSMIVVTATSGTNNQTITLTLQVN